MTAGDPPERHKRTLAYYQSQQREGMPSATTLGPLPEGQPPGADDAELPGLPFGATLDARAFETLSAEYASRPTGAEYASRPTGAHATAAQFAGTLLGDPNPRQTAAQAGMVAPETVAPEPAVPTTAYREYSDGVMITSARELVTRPDRMDVTVFPLPYASHEVIRRIGPYDVLSELGRGGMGVVYKAYSLRLCRLCALKVMIPGPRAHPAVLVRFQNEAMLAARLSHPNIVHVFDAGEEDGQFYFVMAFVKARSLLEYATERALDSRSVARVVARCARALHYAHQHGIVHRDVKPDNILVDDEGEPHITDFGIAANVQTDRRLTHDGALMGTPHYMSPEQINGEVARIGPASDVYSLGATLYHVLAGREMFNARNVIVLLQKAQDEEPVPPSVAAKSHSRRSISIDLDRICLKSVEKQASRRYPTALALADDLDAFVEGRPVAARPISSVERLQKLVRRNRGAFAIASVVFTTLLVVGLSFGAVTVVNIERTSETLRDQDEQAGLEQAATLERAIRVNMLQGRADVVRELVHTLREDPVAKSIDVVRVDRSYAYTDLSTRKQVERRLSDPSVIEKIEKTRPEFMDKIDEVRRLAFTNIDTHRAPLGVFDYDRVEWAALVESAEALTERGSMEGEPVLTVFKPITNTEDCQVCHGAPGEVGYGKNDVRAVLVVRRSQAMVEARIATNRQLALWVGIGTTAAILALVWVFAMVFGLRLRRRSFADAGA